MRLLSFCPRITKRDLSIIATTAWSVRLLSLGTVYRQVIVDARTKTVAIYSRYLWFLVRRRAVRFSSVSAVTYGYEDVSPDAFFSYAHDSYDRFTVGLRLADDSQVHLFSFVGEGTYTNNGPFPDWFYWDDFAFDISGNQETESRAFVEVLAKLIGVKVAPPSIL
jgi:hypothetical protein